MMNKLFQVLLLLILSTSAEAQFKTPSSASNAGRAFGSVFSQNRFAGQLSAAYSSSLVTNFQNPASYADAGLTSIDVGLFNTSGSFSINDTGYSSGGPGISYFAYQMPLTLGKSGMSFGFVRTSNTNYSIKNNSVDPVFGSFSNQKTGTGNKYRAYVGTGFKFDKLKVGANLAFTFGQVEYTDDIVFPDSVSLPRLAKNNIVSEFGLEYTLGAQYQFELEKGKDIMLGGYYTSTLSKSGSNEFKRQNVYARTGGFEYQTLSDSSFDVDLPVYSKLGLGVSYLKNNYLLLGTEFNFEDFSEYRSTINSDSLQNAWHLHLGAEYKPFMNRDNNSRNYFNRLTYRFGAVVGKSEQNFAGTINDIKLMGGATLPVLGRDVGYLTIGAEYGIRGFGGDIGQVQENSFTIHLIITFADKWFLRQKFD